MINETIPSSTLFFRKLGIKIYNTYFLFGDSFFMGNI
jgi:hypothetical protein